MNVWISLLALVMFVGWLTRDDWGKRRAKTPPAMDAKLYACLIEQQARIDLHMTATRLLLKTHPNRDDMAVLLRAAATHLSETSAKELTDLHPVYEEALRNALISLVGD